MGRWPDPEHDNHYDGDLQTLDSICKLIVLLDTSIEPWIVGLVSLLVVIGGVSWVFCAYCAQLRVVAFWTVLHELFKEPLLSHRVLQFRPGQADEATLPSFSFRVYFHAEAKTMRDTFPPTFVELVGEEFVWWYVLCARVVHARAWNWIGAIVGVSYFTVINRLLPAGLFVSLFSTYFLLDMVFRVISFVKVWVMWGSVFVSNVGVAKCRRHGIRVSYKKRWQVFWQGIFGETQVSREYLCFTVRRPCPEISVSVTLEDPGEVYESGSGVESVDEAGAGGEGERDPLIQSGLRLEKHHAVILLPARSHDFPAILTGYVSAWEFARLALACEARMEARASYRNWLEFFDVLNKRLARRGIQLGYGFCRAEWWLFALPIVPIPFPFSWWPLLPPPAAVRWINANLGSWHEPAIFVRFLNPGFPEKKLFDGADVVRMRSAKGRRILERVAQPFVVFSMNAARMVALTTIQAARNFRVFRGKWDGEPAHTRARLMVHLAIHTVMLPLLVFVVAACAKTMGMCLLLIVLYASVLGFWATVDVFQCWRAYRWVSYLYMTVPFSVLAMHLLIMVNLTPRMLPLVVYSSIVLVVSFFCAIQLNRHSLNLKYPYPDILTPSYPILDEDFPVLEDVLEGTAEEEPPRMRALSRRGVSGGRVCVQGVPSERADVAMSFLLVVGDEAS